MLFVCFLNATGAKSYTTPPPPISLNVNVKATTTTTTTTTTKKKQLASKNPQAARPKAFYFLPFFHFSSPSARPSASCPTPTSLRNALHNWSLGILKGSTVWSKLECPFLGVTIFFPKVGGWTKPFEKYARQLGSFPQVGMKIKKKRNHQVVPNFTAVARSVFPIFFNWSKSRLKHTRTRRIVWSQTQGLFPTKIPQFLSS